MKRLIVLHLAAGLSIALSPTPCAAPSAGTQSRAEPARLANAVTVLPVYEDRDCFTPEQLAAVEALDAIPDEQIETLLTSDDSWVVGIGIHLADVRLRPDILLKHSELLKDTRRTVPNGMCAEGWRFIQPPDDAFSTHRMTVNRRFSLAAEAWFGGYFRSVAEFNDCLSPDADAWSYLNPWRELLRRARQNADPERIADAKRRVLDAPPALRWAILAREAAFPADENPVFTPDDLRDAMRALDNTTKDAILRGEAPLPPDALWNRDQDQRAEFSAWLHDAARACLR
ncbi:MAG: hypothetical protein KF684_03975 [Phycisphaeraceae bacterium]|nr:hypothetical protein [Phycisphaeraceae bacterium]